MSIMERNEIKRNVCRVAENLFKEQADIEKDNNNFIEKFRMTSIDVLEFLLAIESEFDFEFEDEYLDESTLEDVNRLLDYISEHTDK